MDKEDLLLEQWKMTSELHRHEDNLIWQRFNYFIAINGILLSVLIIAWSDFRADETILRIISAVLSFFGVVISILWVVILERGRLYQNYRIFQAKEAERALLIADERVLNLYEKSLNEQGLVNVSVLGKWRIQVVLNIFGGILIVLWLILGLNFIFNWINIAP